MTNGGFKNESNLLAGQNELYRDGLADSNGGYVFQIYPIGGMRKKHGLGGFKPQEQKT